MMLKISSIAVILLLQTIAISYGLDLKAVDDSILDVHSTLKVKMDLVPVASQYSQLGYFLGLYYSTLEVISIDNRGQVGPSQTDMLVAWLQQQDAVRKPSWRSMVEALAVNNSKLAEKIAQKHKKGARPSHQSDDPILKKVDDTTLTTSHLKDLLDALTPGGPFSWYDLGLACGLYPQTLEAIAADRREKFADSLTDALAEWLKHSDQVREIGLPSWKALVSALLNPIVNRRALAERIAQSHQKGGRSGL